MKDEIISLTLVAAIMGLGYGAARLQDHLDKKIAPCGCGIQCPCDSTNRIEQRNAILKSLEKIGD